MSTTDISRRAALRAGLLLVGAAGAANFGVATANPPSATKPVAPGTPPVPSAVPSVAPSTTPQVASTPTPWFRISLAQWSLHNALFKGTLDHLDFPKVTREDYGIEAVEYVNIFFKEKTKESYLAEMKKRCTDHGVTSVLIMCDGEGALGDADSAKRATAVSNHHKWVDAAAFLGCHSIRVNAQSEGTFDEQQARAADGLRSLCEYGEKHNINVIVENHGGLSSNGEWLAGVMKRVAHPRVGTLPDFGNFNIGDGKTYDMYKGVEELMPFAKGVSAKSHDFLASGEESAKDYSRLMGIVRAAGYRGHVGIEYEGTKLPEPAGIRATKALLEKILARG